MEMFIPTGEHSQRVALNELLKSDFVIFLVSSYYGSEIDSCVCKEICKAECGMKTGDEKICYTWCEYRFSRAEGKPHMSYIIDDEKQQSETKDHKPEEFEKLQKFRNEVEAEFCKRVKKEDAQEIVNDLVLNIVNMYSDGKINFNNFVGRRKELKELFEKLNQGKCTEVYGVGGVGKTTLCDIVLLLYNAMGRKIVYIGVEEAYSSGTGYVPASSILNPKYSRSFSIDDIIDHLSLSQEIKKENLESKINAILSKLNEEGIILFIDNPTNDFGFRELIKKGNTYLTNGSILFASKKELGIALFRVNLKSIEQDERINLVKTMAERLGKSLTQDEMKNIAEIGEGHPVATYLLVSNAAERIGIKDMKRFKQGLDFSKPNDVNEYINRLFSLFSEDEYNFLKNVSTIINFDGCADNDILREILKTDVVEKVIDANVMTKKGRKLMWTLNQFQDAIFEDTPERYKLALQYYQIKFDREKKIEDEIKILICKCKISYSQEIYKRFKELVKIDSTKSAYELLPILGEEIIKNLRKEDEKSEIYFILGNIYWEISKYKLRAENCKKAIKAYEEALKIYTEDKFPEVHTLIMKNLRLALTFCH